MAKSLSRITTQIDTVKRHISQLEYVVRGSVSKVSMTCGNPACICKRDPAPVHGPYHYFTKNVAGSTKGFKLKEHEETYAAMNSTQVSCGLDQPV